MAKGKYKKWLEPDNLTKLEGWARDGLKDTQIADNMGINVSTLYTWKNRYSEINEALKKGKEVVDYEIENSLISTMKKHTVTTTQYKMVKKDDFKLKAEREEFMNIYKFDHPEASKNEILIATAKGVEVYEKIPIIRTVTEVDPNVSAMIFWLKARRPDVFRDQTFKKLNEANARKAIAEANISEKQLKALEEADNPDNATVVVDDISKLKELRDKNADSSTKQGD
ncbi:helix-turn-helix domain-containing protein [Lactobacillus crispatus]|uniref:Helix-turn-helix domain-containing protein n=1 Tax=Lactobacillus crispatus TaxID=47770 RepID=A0A6A1Z753_9LACO|nr:helix-turn-helix domain-containing protein [Lactobacillus crispatus]KAB1977229.1 helix-turn-helix domain-containing protein [Lactobacillus crispatus]MCT3538076.1 helix-turn-helix domain-containing protein [Lactobacillus crispatus]